MAEEGQDNKICWGEEVSYQDFIKRIDETVSSFPGSSAAMQLSIDMSFTRNFENLSAANIDLVLAKLRLVKISQVSLFGTPSRLQPFRQLFKTLGTIATVQQVEIEPAVYDNKDFIAIALRSLSQVKTLRFTDIGRVDGLQVILGNLKGHPCLHTIEITMCSDVFGKALGMILPKLGTTPMLSKVALGATAWDNLNPSACETINFVPKDAPLITSLLKYPFSISLDTFSLLPDKVVQAFSKIMIASSTTGLALSNGLIEPLALANALATFPIKTIAVSNWPSMGPNICWPSSMPLVNACHRPQ
jgi:hypothetical protein